MTTRSHRPHVICHMAASLDGRIVVNGWPESVAAAVRREYDELHAGFGAEGWMCGRITMEPFAKGLRTDVELATEYQGTAARPDFRAEGKLESFAFAIDARGRLAWESNEIGGDHVVAIVSERVSDEYLAFLRARRVSYILAGTRDVDLSLALERIGDRFGVRTLMLEGGGRINGEMLAAGLIDEVSVLVAPAVDGRPGTPALFDVRSDGASHRLALAQVERRRGDLIWLRYRVEPEPDTER
jgi:2,5-diamino-6-(ribosylamino)-4(3H)-pyrimidinone 5'-phosphate reductase